MYFQPQLLPNNTISIEQRELFTTGGLDLKSLKSEFYFASYKRDGIRAEIYHGLLYTRSLKRFENKYLEEFLVEILDVSDVFGLILEGELYSPTVSFDELSGILRSREGKLPDDLAFYCFDCIVNKNLKKVFRARVDDYKAITANHYIPVEQFQLGVNYIGLYFKDAIKYGHEGLVLKNPEESYKMGRATHNQNIGYKMKDFQTFDMKVIGFEERMINTSESFVNELGKKAKHDFKEHKVSAGMVGSILASYNGKIQKVSVSPWTDKEKKAYWTGQKQHCGRMFECKGVLNSKGNIVLPTFYKWRNDLDETNEK